MGKRNENLFYASDLNGKPMEQETLDKNLFEDSQLEIERKILNKVKRGLSFLQGWHLCPNCNVVFGLEEGEEGICPNCKNRFKNERGDLIVKGLPAGEKEIEEKEQGEEFVRGFDEGFEDGFEDGFKKGEETEEEEEEDIKKIGVADCPYCEKSIDWDKIEPRSGFLRVIKECPKCGKEIYVLDRNERIWSRRDAEEEEEFGLL